MFLNSVKAVLRFIYEMWFESGVNIYKTLWSKITGKQPQQKPQIKYTIASPKNVTIEFDELYVFVTDTASLALFDPQVLAHRLNDEVDWLAESSFHEIPEVKQGDIGLMGLGADGGYYIKPFLQQLPHELQQKNLKKITLGVKIISGHCFIGNGESVPADGQNTTPDTIKHNDGGFLTIDNGLYDVDVYQYQEHSLEEEEEVDVIALVFKTRTAEFVAPTSEPHLDDLS